MYFLNCKQYGFIRLRNRCNPQLWRGRIKIVFSGALAQLLLACAPFVFTLLSRYIGNVCR